MKTFAITSTLTAMWTSPVIALLILIGLVFLADLLNRYLENKKIICLDTKFTDWSYRDIQAYAKANHIRANQKKQTLINLLKGV